MRTAKALQFVATFGLALLVVLSPMTAAAQSDRGVITGRVSDPQSAIVVGATVIARHAETGVFFLNVTATTETMPCVPPVIVR